MINIKSINKQLRRKSGFTIVELLVAAVVLLVVIISLISVMRYMRREQNLDYHRRQARAVINRTFENVFAYTFFPGAYTFQDRFVFAGYVKEKDEDGNDTDVDTDEEIWEPLRLSVDASTPIIERTLEGNKDGFDLDRRGGDYASVPAKMYVRIERKPETIGTDIIITHIITLTVEWTEIGEVTPERITLTKRLAEVL